MPVPPVPADQIVITASHAPQAQDQTAASVSVIDRQLIDSLSEPLLSNLIRLTPSAAVVTSGPAGSLTEIRIRGAEANHTLLFVDGIKIDDPASGDTPRYEILNADLASRLEIVRGPQSALWGSEAIGGVIAVNGVDDVDGYSASAEAGSFGSVRGSGSASYAGERTSLSGAIGFQRARGINSVEGPGDKDGYRNLSGRLRGTWRPTNLLHVGASLLALTGRSQFDGFDLFTGAHTDTLDNSRNRLTAGRVWAIYGDDASDWRAKVAGTLLGSSNKNYLAELEQNRTRGERRNLSAQLERKLTTGAVTHRLIVAADTEREEFHARDTAFGGFTNQDRTRRHTSVAGEWRAETDSVAADVAVRHDSFDRFKDATTLRASLLGQLGHGFALAGSYGEGIAQPTFFDLYGFFPGSFVGNPNLKPESSRGFELSLRYRRGTVGASLTGYQQRLRDEIVNNATFTSVINATGKSKRSGVEATLDWMPTAAIRLSANYAYLKSTQLDALSGGQQTEVRRPKHSGAVAVDGKSGAFTYGASLAYVGKHLDNRDVFPFDRVTLGSYWLADARVAYAIRPGVELFARGSNLLNQHYQDVYSYRTNPRGLFGGVRLSR
ncbi:TonB-dependent receptor plug domain-containing protein [Sphingomonas flavescens]|uniref:TonB-dependent receptor plug domain-containing protein n=1 Tax=Sphingomonas flavescens TaxID=3132797 RepID=UPI0028047015|nr:TonB-dependent receptor [Sphingomonas limnosediminicola]